MIFLIDAKMRFLFRQSRLFKLIDRAGEIELEYLGYVVLVLQKA